MVLEISPPDVLAKSIYDMELENGDDLFVPENPQSVQTIGAVFNQTAFVFDRSKGLDEYIELAGGYTQSADKDRVFVLKVNGSAVRPDGGRLFFFPRTAHETRDGKPLLEPGTASWSPRNWSGSPGSGKSRTSPRSCSRSPWQPAS